MPRDGHPPYFPFYPDDFASDGDVEAMTTEQVGAYMLLLCKAWRETPVGSVPDDDRKLARWARLSPEQWSEAKPAVMAPFSLGTDGRWHQPRMSREYMRLRESSRKRTEAGARGAERRWAQHGRGNAIAKPRPGHSNANGEAMPIDGTSPSSSVCDADASLSPFKRNCADGVSTSENYERNSSVERREAASIGQMQTVLQEWNLVPGVRQAKNLNASRKRALNARFRDQHWLESWREALGKVGQSAFCMGRNQRNWIATFDFFIKPDTVLKLLEGQYDSRSGVDFSGLEEFLSDDKA